MIKILPSPQLANEIVELARKKYKIEIKDTISAGIKVAAAVAVQETKLGDDERVKAKLLGIVCEAFDEGLVSVRM